MLIDHPSLQPLLIPFRTYLVRGFHEMQSGSNRFVATSFEIFAADVYERVGELDNCLEGMRIAITEIVDIAKNQESRPKAFRYHYENYLLRFPGLLDRAYRVAGTVVGVKRGKLDTIRTNSVVLNAVKIKFPAVHDRLIELQELLGDKKKIRNEVAHSKAFSSRELGLFMAVELLNYESVDLAQLRRLMAEHFSGEAGRLGILTVQAETKLYQLLDALGPTILNNAEVLPN